MSQFPPFLWGAYPVGMKEFLISSCEYIIVNNILNIYQIHTKLGMEIPCLFVKTSRQSSKDFVFIATFEKCTKEESKPHKKKKIRRNFFESLLAHTYLAYALGDFFHIWNVAFPKWNAPPCWITCHSDITSRHYIRTSNFVAPLNIIYSLCLRASRFLWPHGALPCVLIYITL